MSKPTSPDAAASDNRSDAAAERADAMAAPDLVPPQAVLPALYALVADVIGAAVADVEAQGKQISCRAGCAACCRQLIPISDTETYATIDLVERLPPARRAEIEARFADAERRIAAWQPLDAVIDADVDAPIAEQARMAAEYFQLGIACPFLEDESCSIYADRPLLCREYLVTSPVSHCASLYALPTESVPLIRPSWALTRLTSDETPPKPTYVPLALALYWHRRQGHDIEPRPLAAWLARFEAASRDVAEKMAHAPAGSVLAQVQRAIDQR